MTTKTTWTDPAALASLTLKSGKHGRPNGDAVERAGAGVADVRDDGARPMTARSLTAERTRELADARARVDALEKEARRRVDAVNESHAVLTERLTKENK